MGKRTFLADRAITLPAASSADGELSEVAVYRKGVYLGIIRIADVLRPQATTAVKSMQQLGIYVALLTEDRKAIADATAQQLGVNEVSAELLPDEKLQFGKTVARNLKERRAPVTANVSRARPHIQA